MSISGISLFSIIVSLKESYVSLLMVVSLTHFSSHYAIFLSLKLELFVFSSNSLSFIQHISSGLLPYAEYNAGFLSKIDVIHCVPQNNPNFLCWVNL